MFISFFSITMRRERNEPKKEKHVELQQCFALQNRMDNVKIFCHPELVSVSQKIFTFQLRYRAYAHAPQLNASFVYNVGLAYNPIMNIHVRPLTPALSRKGIGKKEYDTKCPRVCNSPSLRFCPKIIIKKMNNFLFNFVSQI